VIVDNAINIKKMSNHLSLTTEKYHDIRRYKSSPRLWTGKQMVDSNGVVGHHL